MFYYYGAKKTLAGAYPRPLFPLVVEPFGGSASYAVHHLRAGTAERALVLEKDARVVEVWHRLLAMTPEEVRALPIPAAGSKTSDFLYMTSATSNAVARCNQMTVTSRMPAIIAVMLERIATVLPLLQGKVTVVADDYRAAPNVEATWFIDPPYQVQSGPPTTKTVYPRGMGYRSGCDSKSLDFQELSTWCQDRRGQTIVCEQAGADWLPFKPLKDLHDSQGSMKSEVVWLAEQSARRVKRRV